MSDRCIEHGERLATVENDLDHVVDVVKEHGVELKAQRKLIETLASEMTKLRFAVYVMAGCTAWNTPQAQSILKVLGDSSWIKLFLQ